MGGDQSDFTDIKQNFNTHSAQNKSVLREKKFNKKNESHFTSI